MKSRLTAAMFGAAALALGAHSTVANAALVATWLDPGTGSFSFVDTGTNGDGAGDLSAASTGLTLSTPMLNGWTFTNASYTMTDTSLGALSTISQVNSGALINATFEAGIITIKTNIAEHGFNANDTLLTINFNSATGVFGNLISGDYITGYNVTFAGSALNGNAVTAEQFSFSAANLVPGASVLAPADMEGWTATTSFTSSATVVPVPPAVLLFGSGLVGLIGVARRKMR